MLTCLIRLLTSDSGILLVGSFLGGKSPLCAFTSGGLSPRWAFTLVGFRLSGLSPWLAFSLVGICFYRILPRSLCSLTLVGFLHGGILPRLAFALVGYNPEEFLFLGGFRLVGLSPQLAFALVGIFLYGLLPQSLWALALVSFSLVDYSLERFLLSSIALEGFFPLVGANLGGSSP
ncbi:unnamed protein product [Ilex paraguariensis]|uniref:Uncharacterized protein n=1 Tax=Ilex paraguariensis TaxID=185542 RepID=A0ABC8USY9_9AQUA